MNTVLRPGTPEEAGMSPARVRRLAELGRGWVEEGVTPALVLLVARRGIVVLHEASGRLGPEPDAPPLQRDSVYPILSLSKPITATALMILVEEGLVGPSRPVQWYIPEFAGPGKERVCVHHLLTHTSGLTDAAWLAAAEVPQPAGAIPPPPMGVHPLVHQWLWVGYRLPLSRAPGEEMSYCSLNVELLGEIVSRVSGQSLAQFAAERLFAPLEMRDTGYGLSAHQRPRLVRRAPDAPRAQLMAFLGVPGLPWACGGVCSTAWDLAVLAQMFLNRGAYGPARPLSSATVAAMTRNQIPGLSSVYDGQAFGEATWGLGWGVHGGKKCLAEGELLSSPALFSHGGGGGTLLCVDPAYELIMVYLSVQAAGGMPPGLGLVEQGQIAWRSDLFVNAATAAVEDWP